MGEFLEKKVSLGGNLWQITDVEERLVEMIVQRYNIPYIVAKILVLRGVSVDEVENFLSPKINFKDIQHYLLILLLILFI